MKARLCGLVAAAVVSATVPCSAFMGGGGLQGVTRSSGTKLLFGFNGLGSPKEEKPEDSGKKDDKKISVGGLAQLITA